MRTTLTIDDEMLARARAKAEQENKSLGDVVSDLMRQAFERPKVSMGAKNGFPVLPRRGVVVTLEMVNSARDSDD